jgi:hypothetical protein
MRKALPSQEYLELAYAAYCEVAARHLGEFARFA